MKNPEKATELVQAAVKAGLDMKEVSRELDASASRPGGLELWCRWVREKIDKKRVTLGY